MLIYGSLTLSCRLRGARLDISFRVANITEDAILGMGFFRENKCLLDLDQGLLHLRSMCYHASTALVTPYPPKYKSDEKLYYQLLQRCRSHAT